MGRHRGAPYKRHQMMFQDDVWEAMMRECERRSIEQHRRVGYSELVNIVMREALSPIVGDSATIASDSTPRPPGIGYEHE